MRVDLADQPSDLCAFLRAKGDPTAPWESWCDLCDTLTVAEGWFGDVGVHEPMDDVGRARVPVVFV